MVPVVLVVALYLVLTLPRLLSADYKVDANVRAKVALAVVLAGEGIVQLVGSTMGGGMARAGIPKPLMIVLSIVQIAGGALLLNPRLTELASKAIALAFLGATLYRGFQIVSGLTGASGVSDSVEALFKARLLIHPVVLGLWIGWFGVRKSANR